jgi:Ser/Thr protein kinase RdoA (MazF antagonist)
VLPVAHSLFDASRLGAWIEREFVTPPVVACRFHRSFINDTYAVDVHGGRCFLRVSQAGWRTPAEVEGELAAIEALHAAGASVARPVPRRRGGFVALAEAPEAIRPVVLFREAAGDELTWFGPSASENARRYGHAVASLHQAAVNIPPPADRQTMDLDALVSMPVDVVGRLLATEDREALVHLGARLRQRLEAADGLTVGFCHGDLNSTNIHFSDDAATVFDFDCCHRGWLANDIAGFARGITLGRSPGGEVDLLMRAFLGGYRSVREISIPDSNSLPAFVLAQRIWMASLHVAGAHRWGAYHFGPAYARRLLGWARVWEGAACFDDW